MEWDVTVHERFVAYHAASKDTHANVSTSPHSPHHKAWTPIEVRRTSCRTARGYIPSPSSHHTISSLTVAVTPQSRISEVSAQLYGIISNYWLWTRVSHVRKLARTHTHGYMSAVRHRDDLMYHIITVSANLFTVISPGHLLCSPHLHLAEFLCRPSYILATIESRAQRCC